MEIFCLKQKKIDPSFRILCRLRALLHSALKRFSKTGKIMSSKKYGLDYKAIIEKLKPIPEDLENWHIDHICPTSKYDFENPEDVRRCFHPDNLQWLLAKDNLTKSNKLKDIHKVPIELHPVSLKEKNVF